MYNNMKYEEIVDNNGNIRENVKLIMDRVYEAKRPVINFKDDILSKLMDVKNQGGFRPRGSINDLKYLVIYTTGQDTYWQDTINLENGTFIYYGDNKNPGVELEATKLKGNKMLRNIFLLNTSNKLIDRKKIPPVFVFSKVNSRDIKFLGLAVPGSNSISEKEWLVALWNLYEGEGRFQNYKAIFTILDTKTGSNKNNDDAAIDLNWLKDLKISRGYESEFAPNTWKEWINSMKYEPLIVANKKKQVRDKKEQIPVGKNKIQMLKQIYNYFNKNPYEFEKFGIYIAKLADNNIVKLDRTRLTKDGGRDAIGIYRKFKNEHSLDTEFALEAKCYDNKNSVGVKETSRLISRIKNREFGVLVTTSYVGRQAYQEIIEDGHPVTIISGKDIIELLWENNITETDKLNEFLKTQFVIE